MIHRFQMDGRYVVIDTCSGSVHAVDRIAYEMIGAYEDAGREELIARMQEQFGEDPAELAECYDQITALKEQGKLFSPDTFENMAGELKKRTSGVVKALCLHVAHTCNLNCAYCFASQGKYHGDRAVMPFEVGKQALDFLVAHSGNRRNLEVDFFGGEPLMNFDVVKQLVAYARSIEKEKNKNFRFTLTTNGLLIDDDVIDFANREMSNVVLSLDGRKEIHDRYRVDYAGNGSWERIVPKFQKLVKAREGKNYYMRGTFTHANPWLHGTEHGTGRMPGRGSGGADAGGPPRRAEAVRGPGPADAETEKGRTPLHLLSLHAGPDRRTVHLQTDLRLRIRNGIYGCDALGRPVPMPSVCRRGAFPAGRRMERRDERNGAGGICGLQRLRTGGMPGLLG